MLVCKLKIKKLLSLFILVLSIEFYCTASFSIIYSKAVFVDINERPLILFFDFHFLATKKQNLEQLHYLEEEIRASEKHIHFLIESMFFFNFNPVENIDTFYHNLSSTINCHEIFSLENSPQDPTATTYIAWELPHTLIMLNKANVSYEFCDPRLKLELEVPTYEKEQVKIAVDYALETSQKHSSKKIAKKISQYFSEYSVDDDHQLVDKMFTSALHNASFNDKKLVIFCGALHGTILATKILPLLGFRKIAEETFPLSKIKQYERNSPLKAKHLKQCCDLMNLRSDENTLSRSLVARRLVL